VPEGLSRAAGICPVFPGQISAATIANLLNINFMEPVYPAGQTHEKKSPDIG
jgi:hypothetical protein